MNILKSSILLFLPICLGACTSQYQVQGVSSESILDGQMAYIKTLEADGRYKPLDSCEVLHGKFSMCGPLDSVVCVRLMLGDNVFVPIVLEAGNVKVNIENSSIKIEGTPLNDRLYAFLNSRDSLAMMRAELPKKESEMYIEGYTQDEVISQLAEEEMQLNRALDKLETKFISDNYDNVLGVTWFMELCKQANMTFGYPTTTPQIDELYGRAPESFRKQKEIVDYMNNCK